MISQFTESVVEEAALRWLSEMDYSIASGADISRVESLERSAYDQVILINRLTYALSRINPNIPNVLIEDAVRKITLQQSSS